MLISPSLKKNDFPMHWFSRENPRSVSSHAVYTVFSTACTMFSRYSCVRCTVRYLFSTAESVATDLHTVHCFSREDPPQAMVMEKSVFS